MVVTIRILSMKKFFIGAFLFFVSLPSFAEFELPGKGVIRYSTGVEKPFNFGFAWSPVEDKFTIGSKAYNMDLPESYSVAITLSKDDSQVWVQEFAQSFIEGFDWEIGDHKIILRKATFAQPVKGNYVLSLDGVDYFLMKNNISITFNFEHRGLTSVRLEGVTKDMGTKR